MHPLIHVMVLIRIMDIYLLIVHVKSQDRLGSVKYELHVSLGIRVTTERRNQ